jgi:hypothetical protein
LWLDKWPAARLLRWEWLRLACATVLLGLGVQSGFSGMLILTAAVYCLINAGALIVLAGRSAVDDLPAAA